MSLLPHAAPHPFPQSALHPNPPARTPHPPPPLRQQLLHPLGNLLLDLIQDDITLALHQIGQRSCHPDPLLDTAGGPPGAIAERTGYSTGPPAGPRGGAAGPQRPGWGLGTDRTAATVTGWLAAGGAREAGSGAAPGLEPGPGPMLGPGPGPGLGSAVALLKGVLWPGVLSAMQRQPYMATVELAASVLLPLAQACARLSPRVMPGGAWLTADGFRAVLACRLRYWPSLVGFLPEEDASQITRAVVRSHISSGENEYCYTPKPHMPMLCPFWVGSCYLKLVLQITPQADGR